MAGSRARSVGPQRADRLLDEHSRQREVLGGLHREACAHPEFPTTMKILCPTDFSMPARAAAQLAVALARPTIGSVELLHVVPPRTTDIGAVATGASVREDKVSQRRTGAAGSRMPRAGDRWRGGYVLARRRGGRVLDPVPGEGHRRRADRDGSAQPTHARALRPRQRRRANRAPRRSAGAHRATRRGTARQASKRGGAAPSRGGARRPARKPRRARLREIAAKPDRVRRDLPEALLADGGVRAPRTHRHARSLQARS